MFWTSSSCYYLASSSQQQSVEKRAARYKIQELAEIPFSLNSSFFRDLHAAPHLWDQRGPQPAFCRLAALGAGLPGLGWFTFSSATARIHPRRCVSNTPSAPASGALPPRSSSWLPVGCWGVSGPCGAGPGCRRSQGTPPLTISIFRCF